MLAGARAEALCELAAEERRQRAISVELAARRDGRAWLPALARPGPLCLLVRRTGRY